jgi:hypothetical protein
VSYEAAVNGRGIPDDGLSKHDQVRVDALIRRSCSYLNAALVQVNRMPTPPRITGFVLINRELTEHPVLCADVAFWADHDGEDPYFVVDDSDPEVAMMSLSSSDLNL